MNAVRMVALLDLTAGVLTALNVFVPDKEWEQVTKWFENNWMIVVVGFAFLTFAVIMGRGLFADIGRQPARELTLAYMLGFVGAALAVIPWILIYRLVLHRLLNRLVSSPLTFRSALESLGPIAAVAVPTSVVSIGILFLTLVSPNWLDHIIISFAFVTLVVGLALELLPYLVFLFRFPKLVVVRLSILIVIASRVYRLVTG